MLYVYDSKLKFHDIKQIVTIVASLFKFGIWALKKVFLIVILLQWRYTNYHTVKWAGFEPVCTDEPTSFPDLTYSM